MKTQEQLHMLVRQKKSITGLKEHKAGNQIGNVFGTSFKTAIVHS